MKKLIFIMMLIAASLVAKSQILVSEEDFSKFFLEKECKVGTKTTLPISIDHSFGRPLVPLDQGNTGACLAFAAAYIMTWQEGQEMGWNVNLPEHQFSPAFLYNIVKEPGVSGTGIEVVDFISKQGCGTLDQFPFHPWDDTTQPSSDLRAQALTYRANDWGIISATNLDVAKEKLLDGPIALGIWYSGYAHGVCVVGYNDTIHIGPYVGGFKYINSYGPNWTGDSVTTWGKDGYGWAPYQDHLWFFMYIENRINKTPKLILELEKLTPHVSTYRPEDFYLCNQTDTLEILSYSNLVVDHHRKFYVPFDTCDSTFNRVIIKIKSPLIDSVLHIRQYNPYASSFFLLDSVVNYFYHDTLSPNDSVVLRRNYECNLFVPTPVLTSNEEITEVVSSGIKVFPNPFVSQTTFQIFLEKKSEVSLKVYDMTGRLISEIFPQQELESGEYSFQFSENISGIYFAEFIINRQKKVIKIISK